MAKRSNEQKLIDIMFEVGFVTRSSPVLQAMDREQYAEWIADQLRIHGFYTQPMGLSWGVLKK